MAVARSCPQCGASVQDGDDFCGNCGTYLGWSAEAASPGHKPVVAQPAVPESAVAESVDPQPVVQEPVNPEPAVEQEPAAGPGPEPQDLATTRPGLWARWRAWVRSRFGGDGGTPTTDEPATRTTAAADRPEAARVRTTAGSELAVGRGPSSVVLGPVLPGRPEAKRPLPTTGVEVEVDGPPCPACGTTNPPGRRFCRRCATPLQGGTAITTATRRRRARSGDTSKWLRRLAALIAVAALVIAGILFYPKAVELFEDLRDRLAKPAPIAPARTAATAEVPGHPAAAAVDGLSNRYWGAPAVGDAVEFTFDQPFRLLSVVVHAGASAQPEQFRDQARPTAVDLVVTSTGGVTRTIPVALNDQPGPQRTDTGISDVVTVRLVVKSAAGLGAGRHVALGEAEFFRRP